MQKLIETLGSFGIEVPADKAEEVKRALSKYYKNNGEVTQTLTKVEGERDAWKERAETAENTLKSFEGIDPESIKGELATWKQKAADAEKAYNDKIYERDFALSKPHWKMLSFLPHQRKRRLWLISRKPGLNSRMARFWALTICWSR